MTFSTSNSPAPGLWKGILSNGKSGYFDPANFVPFIETRASPASPASRAQLTRKGTGVLWVGERTQSTFLRVVLIGYTYLKVL